MKSKKSLKELVEKVEVLQEDEQGQLKGGFASLSSLELQVDEQEELNVFCKNNNCSFPATMPGPGI